MPECSDDRRAQPPHGPSPHTAVARKTRASPSTRKLRRGHHTSALNAARAPAARPRAGALELGDAEAPRAGQRSTALSPARRSRSHAPPDSPSAEPLKITSFWLAAPGACTLARLGP